jgi:hypothetical protein
MALRFLADHCVSNSTVQSLREAHHEVLRLKDVLQVESSDTLLRDAIQRTLQAADIAGIRALAVHAKDEKARRFYEHFDFVPSRTDPMHLFVLLKDVRRTIAE